MTFRRFDQYSSQEEAVFNRFLDYYANQPGWEEVKEHLSNYEVHPDGIEDYDIRCTTKHGYITFDIQVSQDFKKYGDLRIDYVSAFQPPSFHTRSIQGFESALADGRVSVDKWGKVIDPKADFLLVEFHNGNTRWRVYSLTQLHQSLTELRDVGQFRTNHKFGESWGSAFLAVCESHQIVQSTRPKTLADLLKQAKVAEINSKIQFNQSQNYLLRQKNKTIYQVKQVKHGLFDEYLRQQLKSPAIQMKLAQVLNL